MSRDYYQILGVSENATPDEIKRAYRTKAREMHPDANAGGASSEEQFKMVNVAYETLKDPEKRRRYDMFGPEGAAGGPGSPGGAGGFGVDFGDIFDAFFGGGNFGGGFGGRRGPGAGSGPAQGNDIGVECQISFVEAVFGAEREVEVRVQTVCETCQGSGAKEGTHPDTCTTCRGRGEVQQVRRTMLGQVVTAHACPQCRGQGVVIAHPCETCRGEGRMAEMQALTLRIPAGIDDGSQLRLTSRGDVGRRGGPSGDLYVRMRVDAPPPGWSRDAATLYYDCAVPMTTATLGGKVTFESLEAEAIEIEVLAGTQSGTESKHRGKGGPRLRGGGRGGLIVELKVQTPAHLDSAQEALLRELAELRGENVETPGVMSRIKNAFR